MVNMKKQKRYEQLRTEVDQIKSDVYLLLSVLQNHRMLRLTDDLNATPIPNTTPNPLCKWLNKESGCGCESSTHYNKLCAFPAWFKDCISFRGVYGELPELYDLYKTTPEEVERVSLKVGEKPVEDQQE